jgi:hypothetical protein
MDHRRTGRAHNCTKQCSINKARARTAMGRPRRSRALHWYWQHLNTLKSQGHRADLFGQYFDRLNALYVMVALGRARKLKKKLGKAMLFRVK